PMTADEIAPLRNIAARFDVPLLQHDPDRGVVEIGPPMPAYEGGSGPLIPRLFHRAVVDADVLFACGAVEPHQYAGFSGGATTIAIGCAGRETIAAMHGLTFLRDPATKLGDVRRNPFARALPRLVADLPEVFALAIVRDVEGRTHAEVGS